MHQKILTLFVLLSCITLKAQLTPSADIINKGIKLFDEKKYAEALEIFNLVNENDSNYNWMLAEKAMTYLSMEKYDSAIVVADKGLSIPGTNHYHLLRTKGTAYDYLGEKEKAIERITSYNVCYTKLLRVYRFGYPGFARPHA